MMQFHRLSQHGLWLVTGLLLTMQNLACGQIIATDNAADPAYADGWVTGTNGGTGFGPWAGAGSYGPSPVMEIDTSPAETDNNLGAPAFRIGTGGIPDAAAGGFIVSRPFSNPMQAGQSFKIDFDGYALNSGTPPGGELLLSFKSASGERLSLYGYFASDGSSYTFGTDFMGINATTANNNQAGGASLPQDPLSGIDWQTNYTFTDSSDGFSLTVDLPTIDTYRVRIVDHSVTKVDVSGQLYNNGTNGEGLDGFTVYGSDINYDPPTNAGRVAYFNNMQILVTPSAGVPGDYNGNGKVDAADYVLWRNGGPLQNEVDNPGTVSAADYTAWRARFGNTSGSGSELGNGAVPEPSVLALILIGFVVTACRRRSH